MSYTAEQIQERRDRFMRETSNLGPMKVKLPRELTKHGSYEGEPGLMIMQFGHQAGTSPRVMNASPEVMLTRDQAVELARRWDQLSPLKRDGFHDGAFASLVEAVEHFYEMVERLLGDVVEQIMDRAMLLRETLREMQAAS